MTITSWVDHAYKILQNAGITTARLDTEILLSGALKKDRSWLHAHGQEPLQTHLSAQDITVLDKNVARRAEHEPIAYIRGLQEFYRRDFFVSPDTLTPRTETETMIELLLARFESTDTSTDDQPGAKLQLIDVGTGSGCIIITAALEFSKLGKRHQAHKYTGLDISSRALTVARKNAQTHNVADSVQFANCDMRTESILSSAQSNHQLIILANLPYVPEDFKINLAASKEPAFAIYGGTDGLDYYRFLFKQLSQQPQQIQTVLTESLPPQHEKLRQVAAAHGFKEAAKQDLIQLFTPVRLPLK